MAKKEIIDELIEGSKDWSIDYSLEEDYLVVNRKGQEVAIVKDETDARLIVSAPLLVKNIFGIIHNLLKDEMVGHLTKDVKMDIEMFFNILEYVYKEKEEE